MQQRIIQHLICPNCSNDNLTLEITQIHNMEIISGHLICIKCKNQYPITNGIPRFIPQTMPENKTKTSAAFGWEWQKFAHLHDIKYYEQQLLDWITPLKPDFFINKIVLDAGCGMGRFSQVIAGIYQAKEVFAIDLSPAVETAYINTQHLNNVHVIQADIYQLPLKKSHLDFAYSIGVLHHLPDPEAGFHSLIQHIKPGGAIFAWVYGYENNAWIIRFINPLREKIFSRLPKLTLYWFSWLLTLGLHPILKLFYSNANLKNTLPYHAYLNWLAQYSFLHTHHVIFDHLVAPTAFYIKQADFAAWFTNAKLESITISWRNQNSWRGFGIIPKNTD